MTPPPKKHEQILWSLFGIFVMLCISTVIAAITFRLAYALFTGDAPDLPSNQR